MKASFLPRPAVIREIIQQNAYIRTFRLELIDKTRPFTFLPGQFVMLSVPHLGEAAISLSSSPTALPLFDLSIRRAGSLTEAVHTMATGDQVGIRGPFGRAFPVEHFAGRDLLVVAGGIGLAPLKGVIDYCLYHQELGDDPVSGMTLLYGSRTPRDIAFQETLSSWQARGVDCRLTVDRAGDEWQGAVGLVTELLDNCTVTENTTALICGPPIMIRFVIAKLVSRGCGDKNIITTLERHMKCGMGICGHCHLDGKLVCVDGPVFTLAQLKKMDVMELG
ncbi:MAG: oxidoreductase [Desulfobulbus sp.]|nr:MAG: oxidoreductase [Desulfobulbus sp.]RUM39327.1 MAG: oxidoreductase [Desulfobulbus sp.]